MAQYTYTPTAGEAGSLPTGWTRRYATGGSITVEDDGTGTYAIEVSGFVGYDKRGLTLDAADGATDAEIYGEFEFTDATVGDLRGLLRGSGSAGSETGYAHGPRWDNLQDAKDLGYYNAGSFNALADAAWTPSANTRYAFRARVSGTTHNLKVWPLSGSEPGSWEVTDTEGTITGSGWVGLLFFYAGGTTRIYFVGVGTGGDSAPTSDSDLTLTAEQDATIYQRSGGAYNLTISGSYTGSPAAIEARIVEDGTTTEVVTWTQIDASPSGGTFSGTLSVPEGGWYNVEVRYSNDTAVTDSSSNRVGVGDVIGLYGQSQMQDFDDGVFTGASPSVTASLKDLTDAGNWTDSGLEAPLVALMDDIGNQTGVPVGAVAGARSGARISELSKGDASGYYSAFVTALNESGCAYIFFNQGGGDIQDGIAKATYRSALDTLYSDLTTDVSGSEFGVQWMARRDPGAGSTGTDANIHAVRSAQIEFLQETAGTLWAGSGPEFDLRDAVHYTETDQVKAGERIALAVLESLGHSTFDARGPKIGSATISGTTVTISISHDGGSSLSLLSGTDPKGIEVLDDGSPVTVSSWTVNAASIVAELSTTPSGTVTVRHAYGQQADAAQSNVIDDAAHSGRSGLPLQATTSDVSVSAADATAPTLSSATIDSAGTSLTLAFSENVTFGAGGNGGLTLNMNGGSASLTYSSGDGTSSLVYTIGRTIGQNETGTLDYTQPGDGIEDTAGNDLSSFTGESITNNSTQDVTSPTLSSTTPADDATNVTITVHPTATFSENIVFGTGNITLRDVAGGSALETFDVTVDTGGGAGTVSISTNTLTIEPTSDLSNSTEYAVQIDSTAIKDTAGNAYAGISDDTTWSWTTQSASTGWPSSLPQDLEVQGFTAEGPMGAVRTEMDSGPAYQRQRFTAAPERFVGRMLIDADQFKTLRTYWRDTLAHGTVSDTWKHPITGESATVLFDATQPYRVTAVSGRLYHVELQFEVLP